MNADKFLKTLEQKKIETERLLESVGDDPLRRNAVINNTYLELYKQDPVFCLCRRCKNN